MGYTFRAPEKEFSTSPDDENTKPTQILNGVLEQSTAHGLSKLVSTRGPAKKYLWAFTVFCIITAVSINGILIILDYVARDVHVMVKLTTANRQPFPAVTVCNMNPIKASALEQNKDLSNILGKKRRKKRSPVELNFPCQSTDSAIDSQSGLCYYRPLQSNGNLQGVNTLHGCWTACVDEGSNLVTVDSQVKEDLVATVITQGHDYWNNLYIPDNAPDDIFLYDGRVPIGTFDSWDSGFPTGKDQCVLAVYDGSNYVWEDTDCSDYLFPICMKLSTCPNPLEPISHKCYFAWDTTSKYSWGDAEQMCEMVGARLATPTTASMWDHIRNNVDTTILNTGTYWINLHTSGPDSASYWNTHTGDVINTLNYWKAPYTFQANKCAVADSNDGHQWLLKECNEKHEVLCEWAYCQYSNGCQNGMCNNIDIGVTECACDDGFEGQNCDHAEGATTASLTTESPTTTESIETTMPPTTTEPPQTTAPPTTTESPATTMGPTTSEIPTSTMAPTTTESLTSTMVPTTTENPDSTLPPTTTETQTTHMPFTTTPLATTKPPSTTVTEPTITSDQTSTKMSLTTSENPTSVSSSTTPKPPTTDWPLTTNTTEPYNVTETESPTNSTQQDPTIAANETNLSVTTNEIFNATSSEETRLATESTTQPIATTTKRIYTTSKPKTGPQPIEGSSIPGRVAQRQDFMREEKVYEILANMDTKDKAKLGYTTPDLILDCEYVGENCDINKFSKFYNAFHGNCYTFNSGWDESQKITYADNSGRKNALQLTINIGQDEYLPNFGDAAGAKIVIHPQRTMPFPEDEGYMISTGIMTSIGLNKVSITRQPEPYGDCAEFDPVDHDVFAEQYPVNYSLLGCYKTCYQKHVIKECGCADADMPMTGASLGSPDVLACNKNNVQTGDCLYLMNEKYSSNKLECNCPIPCRQDLYLPELSTTIWPSDRRKETILSKYGTLGKEMLKNDKYKNNILKLEVYFKDLNYEAITETPLYGVADFASDLGGTVSLWIGASSVSLMEWFECVLDLIVLGIMKIYAKRK